MANGHTSVRGVFGPAMTNNSTFNQTLEVFSKGIDELERVMTSITPPSRTGDRRGSASGGRPISMMSASRGLGPALGRGALRRHGRIPATRIRSASNVALDEQLRIGGELRTQCAESTDATQ